MLAAQFGLLMQLGNIKGGYLQAKMAEVTRR
jgi:hypothetical protein